MSFLSSRSQRSVSPSPLSPSQISNSQHGNPHHHRSPSPSSLSTHIGSLQISDPQSPVAVADHVSGTSASAESGGSSKKQTGLSIANLLRVLGERVFLGRGVAILVPQIFLGG
ncbi:uncharacterized protein LOC120016843 isoform X2 [Tripterygium wilfordii]|uniref:uncharacterized protein LOC120016843 isoform X2 n=1 Tax=Tripterygium wilfordii TaxID=458696 RepID=UPI0018F84104|nr:uncharacterized protein LOC120016843 isoform X2 [Tripterygium wilfordii]